MEKKVIIKEFKLGTPIDIVVYPTDSYTAVVSKIKYAVNPKFPTFVFIEKDFSLKTLLDGKAEFFNLETAPVLFVRKQTRKDININIEIIREILKKFSFVAPSKESFLIETIFYLLIFKIYCSQSQISKKMPSTSKKKTRLPSTVRTKPSSTTRESSPTKTLSSTTRESSPTRTPSSTTSNTPTTSSKTNEKPIPSIFYLNIFFDVSTLEKYITSNQENILYATVVSSSYIASFTRNVKPLLPESFRFTFESIAQKLKFIFNDNRREIEKIKKDVESSTRNFGEFVKITPKSYTPTNYDGRIIQFKLKTDKLSSFIFNNLSLNDELPIAKFKQFYKFHDSFQGNYSYGNSTSDKLYIFRRDKNNTIFPFLTVENVEHGLAIEVLLLSTSSFNSVDRVLKFLYPSFETSDIQNTKKIGIIGTFDFLDCSFQHFLLSDMIMNNRLFSSFVMLNDSDKISRDNKNIYLYFKSEFDKSNEGDSEIGGWNREQSRFGQLTASLYPLKRDDSTFYIQAKIHRALNENIVEQFQFVMSRLLSLYENEKKSTESYFKKYHPELKENIIETKLISSKAGSLGYENSMLFPGEYVRCCQGNRKPKLLKTLSEVEALNLSPSDLETRILKFPLETTFFQETKIEPAYYYAYRDEEPHMGYVKMKNLKRPHPFDGYVPCTFGRPQKTKNERVEKLLYENELIVKKKKNVTMYRTKKKKIMSNTGQIGVLTKLLDNFFFSLHPDKTFVHIGISDQYISSTLYVACHYATHGDLKSLSETFRLDIIDNNFHYCGYQENCENGIKSIENILDSDSDILDARKFFSIVEKIFDINLIIVDNDGNFVPPDSCFVFSYYEHKRRPFVFLLEHSSPIRYEIIGTQTDGIVEMKFDVSNPFYQDLLLLRKQYLRTFQENKIYKPLSFPLYHSFFENLPIQSQTITKSGQAIMIHCNFNSHSIPIYFETLLPPFSIKQCASIPDLPDELIVYEFLGNFCDLPIKDLIYLSNSTGYFRLESIPVLFPFQKNKNSLIHNRNLESYHPFLFFWKPNTQIIENILYMYIVSIMIKNYILYTIKSKENLQDYKDNFLSFSPKSTFLHKSISPSVHENEWLYDKKSLKIPTELKNILLYFLEWNQIFNQSEINSWKKKKELDIFQFSNQFQNKFHTSVQTDTNSHENIIFQTYHTFPIDAIPNHLPYEKILFHYNETSDLIQQFFLYPIRKFTIVSVEKEKVLSILYQYFNTGIFSWNITKFYHENEKYKSKYVIREHPNYFFVLFQFT